ncbi:MAG: hypothetical protein QXF61_07035 [Nitrososphaeria archaeon]
MNKGLALTVNAILEGLFFIAVIALLYWFFISRILEIHITTISSDVERRSINLANVLISHEKLCYEENGKIHRGLIDSKKLDYLASAKGGSKSLNSSDFISQALKNYKDIGVGYPNTISLVVISDLEDCEEEHGCTIWFITLANSNFTAKPSSNQFTDCLIENFKTDAASWGRRIGGCGVGGVIGAGIGSVVPGLGTALGAAIGCGIGFLSTLWEPQDLVKCGKNFAPEQTENFFYSGNFASSQGLPILIKYHDGKVHVGRIIVSVVEWFGIKA